MNEANKNSLNSYVHLYFILNIYLILVDTNYLL